jgi:uncharacterized membrane protein YgcG
VQAASSRVYDEIGYLSSSDKETLEQEISRLNRDYPIDLVLVVANTVSGDSRQYAARFMQNNDIGYGEQNDGVILLHEPYDRNITIVFRGSLQNAFSEKIQDQILDDCTELLQEDDVIGAYEVVIEDLANCMERVANGASIRPMDVHGGKIGGFAVFAFLLSFVVMAIPTLLLTLHQRSGMQMIRPQPNADTYIPKDGFHLLGKRDQFIRSNTIRMPKPKDEGKGGGGGSFKSGGESFSGSSRHY